MDLSNIAAESSIRFSFRCFTTRAEFEFVFSETQLMIEDLKTTLIRSPWDRLCDPASRNVSDCKQYRSYRTLGMNGNS